MCFDYADHTPPPPPPPPPPNQPPVAVANGPYTGQVGQPVVMSAAGSFDPEGAQLSFAWDFGDGQQGAGDTPTHVYGSGGVYNVRLTVSDGSRSASDATTANIVWVGFQPPPTNTGAGPG